MGICILEVICKDFNNCYLLGSNFQIGCYTSLEGSWIYVAIKVSEKYRLPSACMPNPLPFLHVSQINIHQIVSSPLNFASKILKYHLPRNNVWEFVFGITRNDMVLFYLLCQCYKKRKL